MLLLLSPGPADPASDCAAAVLATAAAILGHLVVFATPEIPACLMYSRIFERYVSVYVDKDVGLPRPRSPCWAVKCRLIDSTFDIASLISQMIASAKNKQIVSIISGIIGSERDQSNHVSFHDWYG